jgi:Glycosyltransferase family 87
MEDDSRWRSLRILLIVSAIPIVVISFLRIHQCWANDAYLDQVSGVWIALANDLCHGVFYRPMFGPLGYGGTRYFPLFFVLHAGLVKLGGHLLIAGHLLSLASVLALLAGVYTLLRRLGVDKLLAGCSALLMLCSESTQLALLAIRGDGLPAALAVWGLCVCAGPTLAFRQLAAAAVLFTLAFSAKVTAVYAPAAACLYFLFSGRRQRARTLAALSVGGFVIVLGTMIIASHGRFIEIFMDSATAGSRWTSVLRIPTRFAMYTGVEDVGGFPFFILAAAALAGWPVSFRRDLPPFYFLTAVGAMLGIFATVGTDYNHLIDLQAAAVVLLAVWISRSGRQQSLFGLAALSIAALMAFFPAARNLRHGQDTLSRRQGFQAVFQAVANNPKQILADNPLIPVLAGQTPYVLDPFMIRAFNHRNPRFAEPLWKMLQEKDFSAVVTLNDPESEEGATVYREVFFGPGFRKNLLANYKLYKKMNENYIFLPRQP